MSVAERTYSFRAAGDLGERMRRASSLLETMLGDPGSDEGQRAAERVAHELTLALLRDRPERGNQSAFMRRTVELVVQTAEKVASDERHASAYAELAAERDGELRRGARTAAARRWRD